MKIREPNSPLVISLTDKAISEVEHCIKCVEPIATQVRLTAIGCYALQLSEWGHYKKAISVA
jgi:hypothetical protein